MVRISRDFVVDCFEKGQKEAAFCESGDVVIFETRDCYDDNDITEEKPLGSRRDGLENPATGPLLVKGAEAGDVLRVEILKIKLREYGVMRTSPSCGAFHHLYQERKARRFFFEQNPETGRTGIWFEPGLWLDCDPMIGVIGTAPEGDGVSSVIPGGHGGNMDCRRIREGAVLYLPINTEGALLALGDLHAKMGDGEVMVCGLETAGEVTVQVKVQKKAGGIGEKFAQGLPFLAEGEEVICIQSALSLDEAAVLAARRMEAFVAEAAGIDDVKAGMLMSLLGNLTICQMVNPWKTVQCSFPRKVLEHYGCLL